MGDSSKRANKKKFDIDDPKLPDWIEEGALQSGGYPYTSKMKSDEYQETLTRLQIELVKLQSWLQNSGERVVTIFEGRDAAGKGGTIFTMREYMNPRTARNVALTKPTETERGQWYFQRYVAHFPTAGEFITFDRSWYNRAGVETVMGFCTPAQLETFLVETPDFERMIVTDGIHLFKFWLDIGQEMQLKRFHERRHSPLKHWKFSPMDVAGISRWDEYSAALNVMLERTDTGYAPWTIIRSNDKRRARLAAIRRILLTLPYEGRDLAAIGSEDQSIIGRGAEFLAST
ncbi:polyphosphate kinase 2 [Pseudochrobactrum asaccharolyticum]|uniref:ADP/GDP-polyphosphate phosphotransferase n=1 Tax=Pseudochrobactrum asaccharolyticum TaxID=354351 RepID=A0A366E0T8_9HYPH|nr:polyphosphate kinase 2 [Ochrobactrum sp. MR28]MBX8815603.1 polyphosphate kinase 2 [Ochrobactrum sp. MR31]RBO95986.1 polyphosphate kinase 2 [Pseudochrobactrum asaccharolyticum]